MVAPRGTYPEVMPFAKVAMSGTMFQCSQANIFPVLANPVITSSKIMTTPVSSQIFRTFCQ